MDMFKGLGVAVITPFTQKLEVDYTALEKVLDHLYSSNSLDFLVALGSTGEATTLSDEEKITLFQFIKEYNNNRIPLMAGHGGNNTAALVGSLNTYDYSGYQGLLSVSPAYIRPTQEGIYKHYLALADASDIPIMLYNVPSRTGSNIEANTVKRLSDHPNILGIKDASADVMQALEISHITSKEFILVSGDDMFIVPLCSVGCEGLISVLGNAYPSLYKNILTACSENDYSKAAGLSNSTLKINSLMYTEGNPVGVKQLMAHLGLCEPYVRLPLSRATAAHSQAIKQHML